MKVTRYENESGEQWCDPREVAMLEADYAAAIKLLKWYTAGVDTARNLIDRAESNDYYGDKL